MRRRYSPGSTSDSFVTAEDTSRSYSSSSYLDSSGSSHTSSDPSTTATVSLVSNGPTDLLSGTSMDEAAFDGQASVSLTELQLRFQRLVQTPSSRAAPLSPSSELPEPRVAAVMVYSPSTSPPSSLFIPDYLSSISVSPLPARPPGTPPTLPALASLSITDPNLTSPSPSPPHSPPPTPRRSARPMEPSPITPSAPLPYTSPLPPPVSALSASPQPRRRVMSPSHHTVSRGTFSFTHSINHSPSTITPVSLLSPLTEIHSDYGGTIPDTHVTSEDLVSFLRPLSQVSRSFYEQTPLENDVELFLLRRKIEELARPDEESASSTWSTTLLPTLDGGSHSNHIDPLPRSSTPVSMIPPRPINPSAHRQSPATMSPYRSTTFPKNKLVEALKRRRNMI
ncbi:hypothetical protein BJ085DRAFT_30696 [Dimargaris cristalligena]|uniref:Uncharacterized protein n=1 Tax=Dimargaris cristalligena TaxID=215637 RepID=A0A4Q0A012_9FUNG|nr:hypothetical protein BJ085DRAFT_30696 [Dimargaris cristalligena]|eukprot:RKP38572.1 hypothetical protein BJ085DRAFT_30696 [Dimargaris cristalligena]